MSVAKLRDYALLMRLDRPIGIWLLLWPSLWGLWIAAEGIPDVPIFLIFIVGVVLMRSAGCVINDYVDRHIDPLVERTKARPIAAGRVTEKEALILFVVLCLSAFGLVLLLNSLTIKLSVVGVFLAASYPFLKRYTHLPQFYLGAAFGWSIPMAFAAQTGSVPTVAWILFAANIFWTVAYDTEYAMVDREDDLKIGVKSTAILFGHFDRMAIALSHFIALSLLFIVGRKTGLGIWFSLGLGLALVLAIYQQWLIYERQPRKCFRAFLNNDWFGVSILLGLITDYAIQ